MNNTQEMSPDFVLMRLVSAAEDDRLDRLDAENGNLPPGAVVSGLGKEVLTHSGVKPGLDISRAPVVEHPGPDAAPPRQSRDSGGGGGSGGGPDAPAAGGPEGRAPLSAPPPPPPQPQPQPAAPQGPVEARGFDFGPGPGLRPQLLVFSNMMRSGERLSRGSGRDAALSPGPTVNNNNSTTAPGPSSTGGVTSSGGGCSSSGSGNNTGGVSSSTGGGQRQQPPPPPLQRQPQPQLRERTWGAHPPEGPGAPGAALLSPLADRPGPIAVIDSKWGCGPGGPGEGGAAVLELARRFGELGVGAVPKMLLRAAELPQCPCQGAGVPGGPGPGDDPTETSDALLVLEGLGSADVSGLGLDECPEDEGERRDFLLHRKREIVEKMSGAFSISGFQVEGAEAAGGGQVCVESSPTPPAQSSPWAASPNLSQASTPRRRPRTPTGWTAAGGDKTLKLPGKSKKGSLKIRLSKLFRTKSCSGSNHLLDKRPSVTYSVSSAGSLVDMASTAGPEQDADR